MAPSRILFLFDNRRDANWGSQATSSELFRLIEERYPKAEIKAHDRFAIPSHAKWRSSASHCELVAYTALPRRVPLRSDQQNLFRCRRFLALLMTT